MCVCVSKSVSLSVCLSFCSSVRLFALLYVFFFFFALFWCSRSQWSVMASISKMSFCYFSHISCRFPWRNFCILLNKTRPYLHSICELWPLKLSGRFTEFIERLWTRKLVTGLQSLQMKEIKIKTSHLTEKLYNRVRRLKEIRQNWKGVKSASAKVSNLAGAYPGYCSMKRLRVFLLSPGLDANPSQGYPQH